MNPNPDSGLGGMDDWIQLDPVYIPPTHGIHTSLFAFACRCVEQGYTHEQIENFIHQGLESHETRRTVSDHEIDAQITGAFLKIHGDLAETEPRRTPIEPRQPKVSKNYSARAARAVYQARKADWDALRKLSTAPFPKDSKEVLSTLFRPKDLINMGVGKRETQTMALEKWLNQSGFDRLEFMVPHPMIAKEGVTKSGRAFRPRTQSNTGPRQRVITDFDIPDMDWHPSLILELAEYCGELPELVMYSGGKGLHAWWRINGASSSAVLEFENEAVRLGADRILMGESSRMQLCRIPQAIRKENGKVQEIVLWNPTNL